jgi:hypothetical protein
LLVRFGRADSRAHWDGDTLVVDTIGLNDISWMDGRGHPHTKQMHVTEKFHREEGDALVVDTIGFDKKTWLDSTGNPHSNAMHLIERYTRPDLGHLNVQITIEDAKALTKPFTWVFTLAPQWELQEYVCQAILDGVEPAPTTPLN